MARGGRAGPWLRRDQSFHKRMPFSRRYSFCSMIEQKQGKDGSMIPLQHLLENPLDLLPQGSRSQHLHVFPVPEDLLDEVVGQEMTL